MADAELTLKIGDAEFHARGDQEWVAEQLQSVAGHFVVGHPKQFDANSNHVGGAEREQVAEGQQTGDRWARQHEISSQQLDQVFDRGRDGLELIVAAAPGDKVKDQVVNLYLLLGIKSLLENGEAFINDEQARAVCVSFSCSDPKHHAEYLKSARRYFLGSKEQGWKLTGPGMTAAAALIKRISE